MKIAVKQLVFEFLNSKDESSDAFRRLWRIASLQGVREFNMQVCGSFRTQLLDVNANGFVPFPVDYLDYSMVGIVNANGEAVPLIHNENIVNVKSAYLLSTNTVQPSPALAGSIENTGYPFLWLNYYSFGDWTHLYGLGGGTPTVGQFTVDEDNRVFVVQPGFPYSSVLVEYLTNGLDEDTNQLTINVFAASAFIAWLRWQDAIDLRKKASISEVRYLASEYGRQKKIAKASINKVRIKEMEVVARRHVKLAARA